MCGRDFSQAGMHSADCTISEFGYIWSNNTALIEPYRNQYENTGPIYALPVLAHYWAYAIVHLLLLYLQFWYVK